MNIPYMIFINACSCAVICGGIFIVRLIITHVFHGRKQWSNRPYWWIIGIYAAMVAANIIGGAIGRSAVRSDIRHNTTQKPVQQVNYMAIYNNCSQHMDIKDRRVIKTLTGIDFCDCAARESMKHITPHTTEQEIYNIVKSATDVCGNKIEKATSYKNK